MAWDALIMLMPRRAEDRDFEPRPGQYYSTGRMSFSSDQVTGTVFPHLNMPFLPNSKFGNAFHNLKPQTDNTSLSSLFVSILQ